MGLLINGCESFCLNIIWKSGFEVRRTGLLKLSFVPTCRRPVHLCRSSCRSNKDSDLVQVADPLESSIILRTCSVTVPLFAMSTSKEMFSPTSRRPLSSPSAHDPEISAKHTPPPEGTTVNGQTTKASNKMSTPPPSAQGYEIGGVVRAK